MITTPTNEYECTMNETTPIPSTPTETGLPALCAPGAYPNLFVIWDQLRTIWTGLHKQPLSRLADRLGIHKQRVTQYATGSNGVNQHAPWPLLMQLCHELGFVIVISPHGAQLFKSPDAVDLELHSALGGQPKPEPVVDPEADARARDQARSTYEGILEDDVAVHADAPVKRDGGDVWVQAWVRIATPTSPATPTAGGA